MGNNRYTKIIENNEANNMWICRDLCEITVLILRFCESFEQITLKAILSKSLQK